jgi:DNA polymerase epsilon subunit 1
MFLFLDFSHWTSAVPVMAEFPIIPIHVVDVDNLYASLDWQRRGSKMMLRHFLRSKTVLTAAIELSRYFQVPVGNIPADSTLFGCDIFYARHLIRQNFALWCSQTERPDLGGKEADDNRQEFEKNFTLYNLFLLCLD